LVAVGATTFTIVAELGLGGAYLPQVAAGVVTGIGFIGGWRHHEARGQCSGNQLGRHFMGHRQYRSRHRSWLQSTRFVATSFNNSSVRTGSGT